MQNVLTHSAIRTAVDLAEHNEAWVGSTLIVFDGLVQDRHYGVRIEVEPAAGGWSGVARDGVGNVGFCWSPSKYAAATASYARYRQNRRASTGENTLDDWARIIERNAAQV